MPAVTGARGARPAGIVPLKAHDTPRPGERRPLASTRPTVLVAATAALLALAACAAPQTAAPPPTFPVVDRTNATPDPLPATQAPSVQARAAAKVAIEVAASIGPAVRAVAPLLDAFRASRDQHPPAARRLLAVDGWRFLGGWWLGTAPNGAELKATLETEAGDTPGWDVTREEAYGPDLQPTFPRDVVRMRFDADQSLPSGARFNFTLVTPLGTRGQVLEATGVGAIAPAPPTPGISVRALNARIGPDGTLMRGDLVLEARLDANTLVIGGEYGPGGLASGAMLTYSGRPLGQLVTEGAGWLIRNDAGSFAL